MPNSASTERPSILTPESWRNQKRDLEMALRGKNAWDVVLHGPRELATKRTSEKAQILSLASPDELTGAAASPASAPSVKSETERKDSDHAPDPKDTTSPPLTAVVEPAKSLQWQRIFARELDMARKQDGIALSMISFRLPALVVDTIGPQETAQQLWRRMDAKYSSSSASAHSFLAEEWTGFRMTDTEDIRGQLDKYHSLHTRMQQAELHMPQGVVLAHLLQSLPPSYSNLRPLLRQTCQTVDSVQSAIIAEQEDRSRTPASSAHSVRAQPSRPLPAHTRQPSHQPQPRSQGPCFTCHKHGHLRRDCPQNFCPVCGQVGHTP